MTPYMERYQAGLWMAASRPFQVKFHTHCSVCMKQITVGQTMIRVFNQETHRAWMCSGCTYRLAIPGFVGKTLGPVSLVP